MKNEQVSTPDASDAQKEAEIRQLLETVQREAHTRKLNRRNTRILHGFLIGILVLLIGATVFRGLVKGKWEFEGFSSLWIFFILGGASTVALSQKHKEATTRLAELDDIRAVGPLAEALEFEDDQIRTIVVNALARLLPRLKASDAPLLNSEQRACLYRALQQSTLPPLSRLTLPILKALEQIGDEEALPQVESLLRQPYLNSEKRAAAETCREFLIQNAEQKRIRKTLLRPVETVEAHPETLLRPAQACTTTAPEELLRAASNHNVTRQTEHWEAQDSQPATQRIHRN
jgi:hypothetical protein